LDVAVNAPRYETKRFGDMPLLDVSSSYDETNKMQAIFIVNRSQTECLTTELHWQDRLPNQIKTVYQLAGTDPKAFNSFENPNQVVATQIVAPGLDDHSTTLAIPPLSFTVLEVELR
jgi:alpha-N-arabinofuranosidase